jgi:hypothetical protein
MQAAGGVEALLSRPNTMVKTTLNVRWKRLIGSAKVSECCPIAAAIQGWAS